MKQEYDVIVMGGGAAGMAAAVKAAERNKNVLLLEKSYRTGRKIHASGNGRCNLMNTGDLRYYGDAEFAKEVFRYSTQSDLMSFFQRYGLILTEEAEGRIYPVTYQAATVCSVLNNAMSVTGVSSVMNSRAESVINQNGFFMVHTTDGKQYTSEKLIIACGGAAQPRLGGSSDGYSLMKSLGHTMIQTKPSLVPLTADSRSISGLSGIRIRCGISLKSEGTTVHTEEGEVLFTDYGISGICVMQCARFADLPDVYVQLDLLTHSFPDSIAARKELLRRQKVFPCCSPLWLLNGILPEKVSFAVLKQAGLEMRGEKISDVDEHMIERIIDTARAYRIRITGTKGMEQAQVTAGGIDCREFHASTMESKIVHGLHAAGEVLNVDGDCGGYNLMFAFVSGLLAGNSI